MKRSFVIAGLLSALLFVDYAQAEDLKKTLGTFGNFMVGSWTPAEQTSQQGPTRHDYNWVLGGNFLHMKTTAKDAMPLIAILGIEPKTNKLAWWAFFADGSVGPIYLTDHSDSKWTFEGDGAGPDGDETVKLIVEKTGDATLTATRISTPAQGEPMTFIQNWKRHR